MKIDYNKIVRDKIPEIIESTGKVCNYITPDTTDIPYEGKALNRKLEEEVEEYFNCMYVKDELEELCDIIEVCYTIADRLKCSPEDLDKLRNKKKEERGGFDKLIYLQSVEDNN